MEGLITPCSACREIRTTSWRPSHWSVTTDSSCTSARKFLITICRCLQIPLGWKLGCPYGILPSILTQRQEHHIDKHAPQDGDGVRHAERADLLHRRARKHVAPVHPLHEVARRPHWTKTLAERQVFRAGRRVDPGPRSHCEYRCGSL